jgi:Fe-S cluster biogenesis protein NfuA
MTKPEDKAFQERVGRIETLIGQIETFPDPAVRDSAVELVQTIMDLHGAGIERMLDLTWEKGEAGREIIDEFASDDLLRSLLLLHGLHPLDIETRVTQALDKVRPYLNSHKGNVELLGVDDGLVRLRLQGSCNGCASSAMTLKLAIEEAIHEYAPDLAGMEVEGAHAG